MQAFSLSLIKGRLGSDQERREIQTSPERNAPEAGLRRARKDQDVERRRRGDRWGASRVLTSPIPIDAHEELSHADDNAVFAVGNARRASSGRRRGSQKGAADGHPLGPSISPGDGRRCANPCKGWPSASASGGFGLDKAPPTDISLCPRDEGPGAGLEPVRNTPRREERKKRRAPIDKLVHRFLESTHIIWPRQFSTSKCERPGGG